MMIFYQYLKEYFHKIPLQKFLLTSIFVAALIFINYRIGIEQRILRAPAWYISLSLFFIFYLFVFGLAYLIQFRWRVQKKIQGNRWLIIFLLLAPFLFALKMIPWHIPLVDTISESAWRKYWNIVLQLPLKLLLLLLILFWLWKKRGNENSFWGFTTKEFKPGPYFLLLMCMVPLIAFASTQHDFLLVYPKVKNIAFIGNHTDHPWLWKLIYEISYGLDFISIEFFFRGFLIIGFLQFAGIDAILPMAAFYCTVHFGKPLGECISSYFGGLVLGVIASRTKTIVGGLMVHLGIAYLMEIGGYLGPL
jgi:hypothetical protein